MKIKKKKFVFEILKFDSRLGGGIIGKTKYSDIRRRRVSAERWLGRARVSRDSIAAAIEPRSWLLLLRSSRVDDVAASERIRPSSPLIRHASMKFPSSLLTFSLRRREARCESEGKIGDRSQVESAVSIGRQNCFVPLKIPRLSKIFCITIRTPWKPTGQFRHRRGSE